MKYNKGKQKERETLELAKYMAKHARIDIEECNNDAITIIHRAYNRFCSSNAINGDEVIYDTSNNEDMKQLLDQGFTMWDIQKVAFVDFPYISHIMIVRNPSNEKKQLKPIVGKTRNKYLDELLLDLMNEIAYFPKDCPEYTAVYNKYMDRTKIYKEIYEGVDFKGRHIVFHDIHTLTIIQEGLNGEYKEGELEVGAIYIGKYDELRLIDTDFDFWEVEEYLTDQSLKRLLEIVLNCE